MRGGNRALARLHQEEATRAIGVLGLPLFKATLAKESGLLVACHTRNRNFSPQKRRVGRAEQTRRGQYLRQHRGRNIEKRQKLVVPGHGVNVEKQRACGV